MTTAPGPCVYRAGWGCFPGRAPSPERGGPVWYRCLLARRHAGDHEVEVAGERVAVAQVPVPPRRGA